MDKHDTLLLACGTTENRKTLCSILDEHYNLLEAANTQQTVLLLQQNSNCIAAVLLDITVPNLIHTELLQDPAVSGLLDQVPVIVITANESSDALQKAFSYGAADVVPLNYDPFAMLHRIENIIDLYLHKRHLEAMVADQSMTMRHRNEMMIDALSSIIEHRSVESGQHILRIRHFTKILLEELVRCCPEYGLTESAVQIISSASALHDIGKISIPDAILNKPGKLTAEEMEIMKGHTRTGCQILQRMGTLGNEEYLRYAHNICHYHHERWDGNGYPEGLSGEDIPICAQVVGIADVYDALTSKRVYKEAYGFDTAVNMILQGDCGIFSPKLLECFKHITHKYEALARSYADGLNPETEKFDVNLPGPTSTKNNESMERTWAKYQALVHYIGAFLIELDLDSGLFHLIYNPYPELVSLQNMSNLTDLQQLVLEKLVVPAQKQEMAAFLSVGIENFIQDGLRRANYRFRLHSHSAGDGEDFDFTLLRINPTDSSRRTLAILCRRAPQAVPALTKHEPTLTAGISYTCRYDEDFTLLQVGSPIGEITGLTYEYLMETHGGRLIELVHPDDREMLRREFHEQLKNGTAISVEHRICTQSGQSLWVMNKSRLAVDHTGQEYLLCVLTDITSTHQEVDRLQQQLSQYEIILAQTENVLFQWDVTTDRIAFSSTWEKIFGFTPISSNVRDALVSGSYFHPDDLPLIFDRISSILNGSAYEMVEVRLATAKGRYLWCRFRASAIRDAEGNLTNIMGIIINIDAEKQAAQALQDQAERDSLTKLLNKNAGRRYAEEYFTRFADNINCALLIIDLDNFKQVNDRYGHLFGDSVLSQAAREIKKLFRTQDIVARIGGDEFMVLMRGISDRTLVENRCKQLITVFRNTFQNKRYQLPLSCSIGVALGPDHGSSYFDLYEHADRALYQAKDMGKNVYVFYDPSAPSARTTVPRATAVSMHIDSDEQPGLANNNIVQYAFQRLYSSQDVSASMNSILAMIGQQMNVSRVYVFENSPDNRFCSNTYEWCNSGIEPEIQNLQNISYETDIPNYDANFNEEGIFYCPDIRELPQHVYDIVAPQGIKSMLHCAIRDNGVFRGYIGFDECVTQRFWTKEQIQVLTYFSEMLSVFLLKKQEQERSAQRASELASILDNQNAWIYIIDPDTCELKYLNAKTRRLAPNVQTGMRCYEALMGRIQRCEGCPSLNIRKEKNASTVLQNQKFNLEIQADATLIPWEGQESCLLTCRELRATKNR